jgi:hypothetical protein
MKLIAQRRFTYGARRLVAEDEFEATDAHGNLLILAGSARKALEESESEAEEVEAPPRRRRKYVRRDLQAEG